MNRDMVLEKLMALDFMAVDLALYLDTHPTDQGAIAQYNKIIKAADAVREKYEKEWGPLCSFRSYAQDNTVFNWVENPWPWQAAGNFELIGGCE